jgi:hypothetical protein
VVGGLSGEADRREVDRRSRSSQQQGPEAADSIGGSKNAKSGGVAYAVKTAVRGGSELLIFVVPRVSDSCRDRHTVMHRLTELASLPLVASLSGCMEFGERVSRNFVIGFADHTPAMNSSSSAF